MSKYHNRKTEVDGITFDSKHEALRWVELKYMQRAGMISDLKRQVRFQLVPPIRKDGKVVQRAVDYVADFTYQQNGNLVVEDAKGMKTDVYKIKKKLMLWLKNVEVKEV